MDAPPVTPTGLVSLIEQLEADHAHLPLYHFLDARLRVTETLYSTQMFDEARSLAAAIQLRVPPGEPVLVIRTHGPLAILSLFAVILAGCVPLLMPLARRGSTAPIVALMEKRGLHYALAGPSVADQLYGDLSVSVLEHSVVIMDTDMRVAPRYWSRPERGGHDILTLQWCGMPDVEADLLAVSHRNVLNCLEWMVASMALEPGHRGLCVQPLDQSDAWLIHVLLPLYLQAPTYFLSIRNIIRRPALWMETMARFQCHYSGAPAFLFEVCQAGDKVASPPPQSLSQVRTLYALTARDNPAVLTRFVDSYAVSGLSGQSLCTVYGFEHSAIWLAGQRMPDWVEHAGRHCVSHGELVPDVAAQLADADLPAGLHALNIIGEADRLPFPEAANSNVPLNADRLQSLAGANWAGVRRTVATGDLVFFRDKQLYIHGRADALILCDDRFVSAEDIEALVIQTFQPRGIRHCLVVPLHSKGEFAVVAECAKREAAARWTPIVAAISELIQETHGAAPVRVLLLRPNSLVPTTDSTLWRQQCREALLSGELLQHIQPAASTKALDP